MRQRVIYHSGNPVIGPSLQTKQVWTCVLKHEGDESSLPLEFAPSFYMHIKLNILHREEISLFCRALSSFVSFYVSHSEAD